MTTQTIAPPKNGTLPPHQAADVVTSLLPIDKIAPSAQNPRKNVTADADLMLALKNAGQLTPVLVRPKNAGYELVFGERRWRAMKANGDKTVRCEVRELTDDQALELMLMEYVQRKDLTPLEEADAFVALRDKLKVGADEIGALIGKERAYVHKRLRLAGLCNGARKALTDGTLLVGAAMQLARIDDHAAQEKFLPQLVKGTDAWENAATESEARRLILDGMRTLAKAPFAVDDAKLVAKAGACTSCPKRSKAQGVLLGETVEGDDKCLDNACWLVKIKAHGDVVLADARAKGKKVLPPDPALWEHSGERLAHNAPYVDMAEQVFVAGAHKHWKQVLKGAEGIVDIVAVDMLGGTHELAEKRAAEKVKASREPKSAPAARSSGGTKSSTKRVIEEDTKVQAAQEVALLSAVALKGEKATPANILRVVVAVLANMRMDNVPALLERRGIKDGGKPQVTLEGVIEKADLSKLQGLAAELLARDDYSREDVCEALKLDVDAIEKKAAEAFKATAKLEDAKGAAPKKATPAKKAKAGKKR